MSCENCANNCRNERIETLEQYRAYRAKTPITNAIVNLTDNCNLRCPYCFTCHNSRDGSLDILKATAEFLIKESERTGIKAPKTIAFFGGEPMLKFDDLIVPFIHWMEDTGIKKDYLFNFCITTNGTLFSKDRIDFLYGHDIPPLLSIDGDKETQDNQRPLAGGGSSFDLIEAQIPYLLERFPSTTFRSAVEPWNADKVFENYIFARNLGFQHYFVTPNVYSEWSNEDAANLMAQISGITMAMYEDIKEGGHICWPDFFIDDLKRSLRKEGGHQTTLNPSRCGLGTVSMGVGVDGVINGCQEHNTYKNNNGDIFFIGNVLSGIDEERHLNLIRAYQRYETPVNFDLEEKCQNCSAKGFCGDNFCPSANLGKGGDILAMPSITCAWRKYFSDYCPAFFEIVKKENNFNAVTALKYKLEG